MCLRLKISPFKKLPLQIQKPPTGYKNPREAFFAPPSGKSFHKSLQKVRIMLLSYLGDVKTILF